MDDDSCVLKYIEIVPLDANAEQFEDLKPVQVKIETDDVTQEYGCSHEENCISEDHTYARKLPMSIADDWKLNTTPVVRLERIMFLSHFSGFCIPSAESSIGEVSQETENEAYTIEPACDSNSRPRVQTDCGKEFATEFALKRHTETHIDKMYSCTECKKCFSAQNKLRQHMNIHSSKYKCSVCGKSCRDRQALIRHGRSHSGEKPFECSVCGKRFSQAGYLPRHSKIHRGEKPYKCQVCDMAFLQSWQLTVHMRVHTGDKPYKCSFCDRRFSTSSHLLSHEGRIHSNITPFSCSYCGKLFARIDEVKCHLRVHTGSKPFSCRHCSEVLETLYQLKTHLLKSHNEGTWFTCHICQKKFGLKGTLKRHMQRHEGVKP